MAETLLTVKEVAELKGCTERYIQRIIGEGKLSAQELEIKGRGSASIEYRIPLSSLDKKLQIKYKRQQKEKAKAQNDYEDTEYFRPIIVAHGRSEHEMINAEEWEEVRFWKGLLDEWTTYRVYLSWTAKARPKQMKNLPPSRTKS